jgi:glycosyltransferase involved in cell wall biosynthesis
METKASIIIPSKDKLSRLRLLLQALEGQVDDSIEVIIVFDGCLQSTLTDFDKLKFSFIPVKVVLKNNVGRAAARNRGIEKANGEIIIFIDDDRIPSENFVKRHIEGHVKNKKCIILGRRRDVSLTENEIEELFFKETLRKGIKGIDARSFLAEKIALPRKPNHPLNWLHFYTGNVSVEKEDLEKAGCFDENFKGWGHEDVDLGIRLCKNRLAFVVDEEAVNYHILHESNYSDKRLEALKNLGYMVDKYKSDFILYRILGYSYLVHKWIGFKDYAYLKSKKK